MKTITTLFLLITGITIPVKSISQQKKPEILVMHVWGMPALHSAQYDSCRSLIQQKFGFTYMVVAGCVVSGSQIRKSTRYNNRTEQQLEERWGKGWYDKYKAELKQCTQGNP